MSPRIRHFGALPRQMAHRNSRNLHQNTHMLFRGLESQPGKAICSPQRNLEELYPLQGRQLPTGTRTPGNLFARLSDATPTTRGTQPSHRQHQWRSQSSGLMPMFPTPCVKQSASAPPQPSQRSSAAFAPAQTCLSHSWRSEMLVRTLHQTSVLSVKEKLLQMAQRSKIESRNAIGIAAQTLQ